MNNKHLTQQNLGFPKTRMRRLRYHPILRSLLQEYQVTHKDLVLPLFVHHGRDVYNPIASMPGHAQFSLDYLPKQIHEICALGISAVLLFGIPEHKDETGSDTYSDDGVVQQAIATIKDLAPDLLVISDCCFCQYTHHGHCGTVTEKTGVPDVDNDLTLELLARQAVSHAEAGSDIIAPSGMMDGMVAAIRTALDDEGFETLPILSYAVKYASSLYGPFRDAAEGAPQFGDRRTYQMDFAKGDEALRETALDIAEGADIVMVKPALAYLDIIQRINLHFAGVPIAAYQVSGEYAMVKAAAEKGWLDEQSVMLESLVAIKRAGAHFIISYAAKEVATWLQEIS